MGSEAGPQQVRAWGPGLEGGVVGMSADFVVEAVGDDVGTLGEFSLLDPNFFIRFISKAGWIILFFLFIQGCLQQLATYKVS